MNPYCLLGPSASSKPTTGSSPSVLKHTELPCSFTLALLAVRLFSPFPWKTLLPSSLLFDDEFNLLSMLRRAGASVQLKEGRR
ncbi:hypothetical protein FKM82_000200 [Ascaphus truei]